VGEVNVFMRHDGESVEDRIMKRAVSLFIGLVLFSTVRSELPPESQMFLEESLNRVNLGQLSLDKEELLPQFTHYDYSSLWTKYDRDILAFIGSDYQRLRVKYLAIIKNAESPEKYYVYGRRLVNSSVCPFIGEIRLIHNRMFSESERTAEYDRLMARADSVWVGSFDSQGNEQLLLTSLDHLDSALAEERYSRSEYSLLAEYRFFEDPNREGTGFFEGILRTDFYVDSGKVCYDTLDLGKDGFRNNQYVGTWTSYVGGAPLESNWGDCRIPHPGDLGSEEDGGDFWPADKYLDMGWRTYVNAMKYDTTAQMEEEREWWKE
jgi:hypothetical protein